MSKARNIADLLDSNGDVQASSLDSQPQLGRRNLIINGDFQVWQRGTVGTAVNGFSINSADRWYSVRTQLNQETDSYGNPYAHCVCGDYADSFYLQHKVEHPHRLLNKTLTLSFWIKSDDGLGANGQYAIRYYTGTTYEYPITFTNFTFGSSWTKVEVTFTMPTTLPADNYGLEIFLMGDSTNTNNNNKSFDIKEVQLELGSVATPFEHRSYGEELALCQRYYYRINTKNTGRRHLVSGVKVETGTDAVAVIYSPVSMRTIPSISYNSSGDFVLDSGGNVTVSSIGINGVSGSNLLELPLVTVGASTTSNYSLAMYGNDVDEYLAFDAEL